MDVLLANPRGFCAGVDRAIEIVERALETFGAPIFVRHEVVHNRYVVDFIQWYWQDHYWPTFNVADSSIVAGAIALLLFGMRDKGGEKKA